MLRSIAPLVLCLAPLAIAAPQKRVKPTGPADFTKSLETAREAWEQKRFGTCIGELQKALGLASRARAEAIRQALPAAPAGFDVVPLDKDDEAMRQNPMIAAMTAAVGNVVTKEYRQQDGSARIKVQVTADSPMVSMLGMMFANPAMADGGELIEYEGDDKALLKIQSNGRTLNLQMLLSKKHVCEVDMTGMDEDALFRMFDQTAVDRLNQVLAN